MIDERRGDVEALLKNASKVVKVGALRIHRRCS